MADTIITRVRKDLIYNLEGITKDSGFENDVKEVYGISKSSENLRQFPSIFVDFTDYENEKLGGYQIDWVANVELTVNLNTEDPEEDRESIIGDIKTKLYEHAKERIGFIPNSSGQSICRSIEINKITFSGIQETKPNYKVFISLELKFSESLDDSTALP